jgi:hypothetical protein
MARPKNPIELLDHPIALQRIQPLIKAHLALFAVDPSIGSCWVTAPQYKRIAAALIESGYDHTRPLVLACHPVRVAVEPSL